MPSSPAERAGEWPMYRGDVRLTGRATLPGELREAPSVAWSYPIESGEAWAVIDPAPGQTAKAVTVERGALAADYLQSPEGKAWGLGPPLVDLHGDGRLVPDPGRAAKLLPDVPGLQTVVFEPAAQATGLDPKQAVCYAYDRGEKREVWRSEVYDTIQNTNFILADVDNDGRLEVVLAPHYRVIVIDGQTGRTRHLLKIHNHRNYGFFCAADVTGDGLLDFVVIADFAMHLDVVKNEGDQLRLLWRRDIEDNIQSKQRIVRPGPNPVLDLNGDGRLEILYNLFNEAGDGRWHVVAEDALTGERVLDLPARYLSGTADVNGDGVPELFVARAEALYVPNSAPLFLLRVRGREATPLWENPRGHWVTEPVSLPLTHSTIVARGTDEVVTVALPGLPEKPVAPGAAPTRHGFLVLEPQADGSERLRACGIDAGGRMKEAWSVELPPRAWMRLRARADIDGDGVDEALISFQQPEPDGARVGPAAATTRVVSLNRTTVQTAAMSASGTRPLAVAALSREQGPSILFENANREIVALAPPDGAARPALRWRLPGAGAPVLADVNGDGFPEVIFADWAESGEGEIVAADARGRALWRHRVSGFPGPHPPWNFGGVTSWWAGRYSSKERCDVWVSARRSTMHSDEAWLLSGRDGKARWHLPEVRTDRTPKEGRGWGAGGSTVCSADVDGDGLEDVISLYPVNYMAAKGSTGELIRSVEAATGLFEGVWGAYCQPIVADFDGDGREELLWCGPYHLGLTALDATVRWYQKGGASVAGVGDVDGDGKLEVGITGWESGGGLRCLDAATGVLKWEWPLEGNARVPVQSGDIDGDGREEFLFTVNTTLFAVNGRAGAPNLVWQVELPAAPGNLVLADVDRDGKIEILFIGADSTLYCLDRPA